MCFANLHFWSCLVPQESTFGILMANLELSRPFLLVGNVEQRGEDVPYQVDMG